MSKDWLKSTIEGSTTLIRNGVNCKQDKSGNGDKISRIETIASAYIDPNRVGYSFLNHDQKNKYRLKVGDILFSHINSAVHVGKTAFVNVDHEIYHGVNLLLLRPIDGLDARYFEYFLKSLFWSGYWRLRCKQSVNQASVNQKDIGCVPISYPQSLAEQKRIVAILDEAFAAIATATANAEKNLANARELFETNRDRLIRQVGSELPTVHIGDVCTKAEYGSSAKSQANGNVPVLRMGNLQDGEIDWTDLAYSSDSDEISKYQLYPNDVLFNRTNSALHVGKTAIYRGNRPAIFAGYLIRIHRDESKIDAEYLNHYLNSKMAREYGWSVMAQSVNQANINASKLKEYPLLLPPLNPQKIIVRKIDSLKKETSQLTSLYEHKHNSLTELKQSILQKAFSGELTTDGKVVGRSLSEAGV